MENNGQLAPIPKGRIDIEITFHPSDGTAQSNMRWVDVLGGTETVLDILLLECQKIRLKMKQEAAQKVQVATRLPPALEG